MTIRARAVPRAGVQAGETDVPAVQLGQGGVHRGTGDPGDT